MINKINKNAFNSFLSLLKERIKKRFIFIILLAIIVSFFGYLYKDIKVEESASNDNLTIKEIQGDRNILSQHIQVNGKPTELIIKLPVDKNKNVKYGISIFEGKKKIKNINIDNKKIDGEFFSILVNDLNIDSNIKLCIELNSEVGKSYFYVDEDSNNSMLVNNKDVNDSLYVKVVYQKFSIFYISIFILLFISGSLLILFFNINSLHNSIFATILVFGLFSAILTPVLDVPDEHDQISRADLASRGILMMGEDYKDYRISNCIGEIINQNWTTIENTDLINTSADWNAESSYYSYGNANLFLGYLPQTVSIWISRILQINCYGVLLLGRLFNLVFYAFLARYAIKKTPIFKVPLSLISIIPMSIFIAASYNPDATTFGIGLVTISYFLYMYKNENITIKNISIYTILCTILGLVKLPYCILAGLLIFLPINKYKNSKLYYKSFIFVAFVAIISLGWAGISVMRTVDSPFQDYFNAYSVNSREQVKYIAENPIRFLSGFSKTAVENSKAYFEQLTTFGWLSYTMPQIIMLLFPIFIGGILFFYPNEEVLCRKTKIGVALVSFGIYASTCLTLYITWTTVGSSAIYGVQGRYFVPMLALMTLLSVGKKSKEYDSKEYDYRFIVIGIMLCMIYIITVMNKYY